MFMSHYILISLINNDHSMETDLIRMFLDNVGKLKYNNDINPLIVFLKANGSYGVLHSKDSNTITDVITLANKKESYRG